MPNTAGSYPMPYPNSSAVPDVPGDILALAQEVDDTLTAALGSLASPGLVGVVPTSVSGTGVTVGADGLVSFSSATAIAVDGCFTAAYRNYRVIIESTGTSASLNANLRASGSDVTTSNYDKTEILARNATVASSTAVAQSNWNFLGVANTLIQADMDLSGPFLSVPTTGITRAGVHSNPAVQNTSNAFIQNYVSHRLSNAYDGIKFTFSASQSGTVRIYGYN